MAFGSLVQKADSLIREWMKTNNLRVGTRIPSERALARQLGLPHYSINRAMANLIFEGMIIREGYKLFCGSSKMTDGLISCHLVINYNSMSLRSFRKVARELGISLIVHRWEGRDEAVSMLHELDSSTTPGIIFEPPFGHGNYSWERTTARLWNHGIPIICTGAAGNGFPSVLADHPLALKLIFEHFNELGHTELAFVSTLRLTPTGTEIMDAWKLLCGQFNFPSSLKRIIEFSPSVVREDIAELINRLSGDWKEVTSLVVYTEGLFNVSHLVEGLAKRKKSVPKDFSIIFLKDQSNFCTMTPAISAANADSSLIHETAFRMIQRLARRKDAMGLTKAGGSVRVHPELILRGSTAPSPNCTRQKRALLAAATPLLPPPGREKNPAEFERNLRSALERPYPLAARTEKSCFEQLDLRPHVNRPLNFRRGWLGDLPLRKFDPGEHVIHGVPFHVNGGNSRSDCGAIIFHSNVNTRGNAKVLPTHLRLSVGSKAKAIYILHGCGYARFLRSFATYSFYRGKSRIDKVPLVSLGQPPADNKTPDFPTANIQDWWPDLPQRNFPHARMAPINEGEGNETISRYVYLYTLEWINPKPERPIDTIEIEVTPEQSTTLGVLAVTILRH